MRSTPAWEEAHNEIKELALCLKYYHDYLLKQNKKTQTNQNLDHPARPVAEFVSVWTVLSTSTHVRLEYVLLDKVLNVVDYYEPICFDEDVHLKGRFENNMQRLRFFERIQLSVNVDIFKYCPGGSIITCYYLTKFPGDRTDSEKATRVAGVMLKIEPKLPEFHTRAMKREFSERFSNIAKVKPAVVDLLYKELAIDASAASNPEMQQRLRLIFIRLNIQCDSPVEIAYYSSKLSRPDICYYCAESGAELQRDLKKSYKSVFPVCCTCLEKGFEHPCFRPYGKKSKLA